MINFQRLWRHRDISLKLVWNFLIWDCSQIPRGQWVRFVDVSLLFAVSLVNSLRPRQNGRYFADDTFKRILLNENVRIWIKNSLKFVPKGPINNNPALVQIMAWRRSGDKLLSEPVMVSLLTHICVTRPQWVKRAKHFFGEQNRCGPLWSHISFWPCPANMTTKIEYFSFFRDQNKQYFRIYTSMKVVL